MIRTQSTQRTMTQLIDKSSPEFFEQTSNEPYIRHDYKIHYMTKKPEVFDNYEDVQRTWFQTPSQFLDYIEVLDHKEPKKKKTTAKGF
jgi:hypothetical protein